MGRKKQETVQENHEITPAQTPGMDKAMQSVELSVNIEKDEILSAGIDLGRLEALDFIATVATSSMLPIFENIKKSKAWQNMRNPQSCYGSKFQSLDEFCEIKLGKSYRRLQDLTSHRKALGQEAFEQAEKLGLRQIDYNAIKALPAPKQAMIKEALAEGADIETVTRALRQLAAEDQREIEALTKDLTEATENYEAQGAVLKKKDETLNKLEKQLHKLQNRAGDWNVRAAEIAIETTRHAAGALEILDKLDVMRETILNEDFGEVVREAAIESMAVVYYDAITQIVNRIAEVTDACDEVFIGYKEKARPMLDVEAFVQKAAKAEAAPTTKAKK